MTNRYRHGSIGSSEGKSVTTMKIITFIVAALFCSGLSGCATNAMTGRSQLSIVSESAAINKSTQLYDAMIESFGVKLLVPQFKMAQKGQNTYWLYVVEKAASSDAKIYRIQNPVSKVVEYRFDDGWQILAQVDTEST